MFDAINHAEMQLQMRSFKISFAKWKQRAIILFMAPEKREKLMFLLQCLMRDVAKELRKLHFVDKVPYLFDYNAQNFELIFRQKSMLRVIHEV